MRVVGLLVYLWDKKMSEKLGDASKGFVVVNEDMAFC